MKHIHPQAVLLFELLPKAFHPQITVSVKGPPPPTAVQAAVDAKHVNSFPQPDTSGSGTQKGIHEALPSHLQ